MTQEIEITVWFSMPQQTDMFWKMFEAQVEAIREQHGINDLRSIDLKPDLEIPQFSSEVGVPMNWKLTVGGYSGE